MFDHKVWKLCAGLLFLIMVSLSLKPAKAEASDFHNFSLIQPVYHVYVDGTEVGTVLKKQSVQQIIDEKISEAENQHPGLTFAVVQDVTYQERKVFRPQLDLQKTLDELKQDLTVKVKAYDMRVGNQSIGYVKNKETGKAIIRQYESKYIPATVIQRLTDSDQSSPVQLKNGALLDVSLSKNVSYDRVKVSPGDLLSVSEGLNLLSGSTKEIESYEVKAGDTLSSIASEFNLSVDTLKQLNPGVLDQGVLKIGEELQVTAPKPFVDVVVQKAVTVDKKIPFDTKVKKDDSMYEGESKVLEQGSPGKEKVRYLVTVENGIVTDKQVKKKTVLVKPTTEVLVKGTKVIPSRGTGEFAWPTVGGVITSKMGMRWGKFHKGVDIAGVSDPAILAADNGVVEFAGWDSGGYGNRVVINHNNGYRTTYNHMSKILVPVGQVVRKGEQIGVMGETGDATGVHLHFEIYKNGHLVHPLNYVHR